MRRILSCTSFFYLDDSNGASIANRAMMQCLARGGFDVEVLCGPVVDAMPGGDPFDCLAGYTQKIDASCQVRGETCLIGGDGIRMVDPPRLSAMIGGVPLTTLRRPFRRNIVDDMAETGELLSLFGSALDRHRPEIVVTYGGDLFTREMLSRAKAQGAVTVFTLHNFAYPSAAIFSDVDAILVPSRFSAEYHRRVLGVDCCALPYLVEHDRVRVERPDPRYVTFVNASPEKGVYAFARIADELGRRRPDIRLLVVESRGTEAHLVNCGIDLRRHGNVFLMAQTSDPREFWSVTRICLVPSLWMESQGLVVVEAMISGIPVIASDRGALPDTLGTAGVSLPLPARLTPFTRVLPTSEEIEPWVEAIIRLWDDEQWYAKQSHLSRIESHRWAPETLEPQYVDFFQSLRPRANRSLTSHDRIMPTCPSKDVTGHTASAVRSRSDFGTFLNACGLLGTGAEIGVQNGCFSRQILDQWHGKTLYMIDIWQPLEGYRDVANVSATEQLERMVRAIRQVSPHWPRVRLVQELSQNAARLFNDESLDWIYIDANHDFENVTKDLGLWIPKVKQGGLISGHDFLDGVLLIDGVETVFEVRRAVTEYFGSSRIDSTEEDFPTWFVTKTR